MIPLQAPKQDRGGGQPAARRDGSRHRRGDAYIPPSASGPPPPTVQVVSSHDGVNRGDARVGAVGGVGVAMLAGGGLLAVRVRREHLDPATR
jgi:hypothetical protein